MLSAAAHNRVSGLLIVVEGIDGAGKSTQVRRLADALSAAGYDVVADREPTDGPWGRKLRESAVSGRMSLAEELHAFLEDRREHVRDVITPALQRGAIVVLDRYYFSTMAYQGIRGADVEQIRRDNEVFAPKPDLVLLVDFDPQIALQRIEHSRGDVPNTFERLDQLQAIRDVFLAAAANDPTFHIVDGSALPDGVQATMWREVSDLLQSRDVRP
ncbi:MAG: dTMP kinase [Pirellulales bacterium]